MSTYNPRSETIRSLTIRILACVSHRENTRTGVTKFAVNKSEDTADITIFLVHTSSRPQIYHRK